MSCAFLSCRNGTWAILCNGVFTEYAAAAVAVEALNADTVVLFDGKKLLRGNPELSAAAWDRVFDVKLACYVNDPSDDYANESAAIKKFFPDTAVENWQEECALLLKIYTQLREKLQDNYIFNHIEQPLSPVLAKMERSGILLDKAGLEEFGKALVCQIKDVEKNIFALAGREFNINSPKQLSTLLFEELALEPAGKKNRNGYSTDAEALEKIRDMHPVVPEILLYRKLSKVNSTYVEGVLKYTGSGNRIHTTFNMTATATGRLSSTEPNLQNIPVAGDTGGAVRKFFIAEPGWVLIDADYSQIELRLLAHIANDPVMIDAFCRNEDIHAVTAAQVFGVELAEVTPEMRRKAKAVNFGIVYGISAFALAGDLNITQAEAREYIKKYFEKYSAVKSYLESSIAGAGKNGYAETLFGRRRALPELHSKIFAVRSFGERVAMNMPIQGSAADLIKLAMIKVDSELAKADLQAKMLLQIHDELLLTAPENEAEKTAQLLKNAMQSAAELSVPLQVSLAMGRDYSSVK